MENKTRFIKDSFIDYKGQERHFVIAAVSIPCDADINEFDESGAHFKELGSLKLLSLGVSVCLPEDQFDLETGITIAEGKAIKHRQHALYSTDKGLINDTMVEALLLQEANYLKRNPGYFIAGYNEAEEKYLKNKKVKEYENSLMGDAKVAYFYLKHAGKLAKEMINMLCPKKN